MGNLDGKGYGLRGSVFTFSKEDGDIVVTSNACRYEDAIEKMNLPPNTRLKNATTFRLLDGKNKDFIVDFIWAVEGATASGKSTVKDLIEKGLITAEQGKAILDSDEIRL